jgi:2-keto-3-deoxy-L-rhamnonate aldolase RhmA
VESTAGRATATGSGTRQAWIVTAAETERSEVKSRFALHLFSTDAAVIRCAVAAGVEAVIVDWENAGKAVRQANADTQINSDTVEDLQRVRNCTAARVVCRINGFGPGTETEVEKAIRAGADEILLPMVRTCREVQELQRIADRRCDVGILVETREAVEISPDLACLPLSRVFVGLNDLAIDRGTANIFAALADGTVERIRRCFPHISFGFGGLTLPERGRPIPCRLLIGEMARLETDFSFLRRSFLRDVKDHGMASAVPQILDAITAAGSRSPREVTADRAELTECIRSMEKVRTS